MLNLAVLALAVAFQPTSAEAQNTAFKQAIAQASANDEDIAAFYKERGYKSLWTGNADRKRRKAFLEALRTAPEHGLPEGRYDADQVRRDFGSIKSSKARGILEVETTKRFLQYAQDIQSGILSPARLSKAMAVVPPRRNRKSLLEAFAKSSPQGFFKSLPPTHPDYLRLMKEKLRLEKVIGMGGWGEKIASKTLKPGQSGNRVVALRNRLTRMGYKKLGISPDYNEALQRAVALFQKDHGLNSDGVAGQATINAINVQAETRLTQVIVGLERQRWLNKPRGQRHIVVNQADFRFHVYESGKSVFTSRVVVGKSSRDLQTAEFSDEMTHLIMNPTWHVPQSIAQKEYLQMAKKDPTAITRSGLRMTDINGRQVDPTTIDYSQYEIGNFPFDLKQPPGRRNALGQVKFMFPNKFNIYLHDTPSKSLFSRDIRAFSHGCVRVHSYLEFAYFLLGKQSADPQGLYERTVATGKETQIDLEQPLPIHLTYMTAWVSADGRSNFRTDIYGRDKLVFKALQKAGVVLRAVRS